MGNKIDSKRAATTSMIVSALDVSLNLIVAILTRSTVLLAQSLQGLSDLVTGFIIFWGIRRSERKPDDNYQLGYGRLVFFWVLISGVIMFAGTGGLSFYFGFKQFTDPQSISNIYLGLAMLTIGFIGNSYALSVSVRRLQQIDLKTNWARQILRSSIVETKATFLVDFMGTGGAIIGLISLTLYVLTSDSRFDGLGSMLIGLSMMMVSALLIKDVGSFIVGKAVDKVVQDQIIHISKKVEGVVDILDLRTMYIGPGKLLILLEVHMKEGLETLQIEKITDKIKATIMNTVTDAHHVQVEVETPEKKHKKQLKIKRKYRKITK